MIDQITASDSSDVMFPLFKVEEHVAGWKMEGHVTKYTVYPLSLPFPPFFPVHVGKVGILKRHTDSFNWFH